MWSAHSVLHTHLSQSLSFSHQDLTIHAVRRPDSPYPNLLRASALGRISSLHASPSFGSEPAAASVRQSGLLQQQDNSCLAGKSCPRALALLRTAATQVSATILKGTLRPFKNGLFANPPAETETETAKCGCCALEETIQEAVERTLDVFTERRPGVSPQVSPSRAGNAFLVGA